MLLSAVPTKVQVQSELPPFITRLWGQLGLPSRVAVISVLVVLLVLGLWRFGRFVGKRTSVWYAVTGIGLVVVAVLYAPIISIGAPV